DAFAAVRHRQAERLWPCHRINGRAAAVHRAYGKHGRRPAMSAFAWSLSRLKDFERCPKLYWYRRNRKAHPEPPSPAMERGEKIHKMFEKALLEDYKLPGALERFQGYVDEHKAMKRLEAERMWAL